MTTLLARVASTVLGAVLVYLVLTHFQPHITTWVLGLSMFTGAIVSRIIASFLFRYPEGSHAEH